MQPSGHRWTFMKAPVIGFQILLFMRLEGTSPGAEHIPCLILCSTFFDSRSWGFAVYRLVEKIVLLLNSGAGSGRYFAVTSNAQDYFGFLHNGSSYNTFPAEIVKKQPKSELVHEVQTVLPVQ
ncbi:uncharacterized protein [Populus alba]|uniref:uncharacterized protein isoform X3 n=1 Tax=Populus alba TaxID=43335 RepID=UPI003CC78136